MMQWLHNQGHYLHQLEEGHIPPTKNTSSCELEHSSSDRFWWLNLNHQNQLHLLLMQWLQNQLYHLHQMVLYSTK